MYESLYGLERPAFAMRPDLDLFYPTPQHREALAAVLYGILQRKGFTVLWGDAGTGKTTILQSICHQLPADSLCCSLITNPVVTAPEFLEMILLNFGVEDIPSGKPRRLLRLQQFLQQSEREAKTSVLIVDEGHRLTPELVEEIRLLTNFGLLEVVLAGQSELGEILREPNMRQVRQRIGVRATLGPLDAVSTSRYIAYRWTKAGGKHLPFTDAALEAVAEISQGLPRLINALCDNALLAIFARVQTVVVPAVVYEAGRDLGIISAPPDSGRESLGSAGLAAKGPRLEDPSAETPAVPSDEAAAKVPGPSAIFRWPRTPRMNFRSRPSAP